ncbi:helix-turn-helix transcriptional regulator [Streptosporangium sandarakinum]|uniref:DNA-binding CsgD family transcriptional regulator n=1 Tax=Streptosporangium sandarakinum TaxID=1260955 RepID=A0A852UWT9_9ACTN|nr:LuxR family transcriptional regulator [Streptosporangium sandarakinum]NYF38191.1 DNA-binding CsgD family transcriptional regulator [Streptosporangium sandarakinum]
MKLVEREEELACLQALLDSAVLGRGKVALVGGAVATGKSALLHVFAEQAIERGALAVTATGSRMERDLPLGVLGQLIQDAPLVPEERDRALALLNEGARAVLAAEPEDTGGRQIDAQTVHVLCTVLLELSERYPLMIIVDDVHHADRASLLCLAYLARRVRLARIVMVFGHADHGRWPDGFFQTELVRQPHCRRIQLTRLSRAGVAALVEEEAGRETADRLADEWYALSGGNPLLANALADDYRQLTRSAADEPPDGVTAGDHYGQAVLSCLQRGHEQTMRVARGLAILGEPESLDRLLGLPGPDVGRELHSLSAAGLLTLGRFRHDAVREAVLAGTDAQERADLHRRAAELGYDLGSSPAVIAGHLLRAGRVEAPWVVPILEEAARSALRTGRVEAAVDYLRMAWRECADETQRAKIMTMLVRAEWRINPAAPTGHLAELAEAMNRGSLRGVDAVVLARALLWYGRFDDARDVLEQLNRPGAAADPETAAELVVSRLWLRATHPPFLDRLRHLAGDQGLATMVSVSVSRRLESALALAEVLTRGPREEDMDAVERILEDSRLDEMTLDTVENSLLALTYAGRCERVAPWCDLFSVEASSRQAPSRQARLAAIRAEIAVRQGDMPAAEHHARLALDIIPVSSWGVAIGGPLSSLILALTAMGKYDAVREYLDRPVPEAMFQTRYGLHYLHARGRHSLATDYFALALRDFQQCGDLMAAWNLDTPGLIPWRADAAEACLRMGQAEEARQLVQAQLDLCGPGATRGRGAALRLLAAVSELRRRPPLLRQATEYLQAAGDRYELARALFDLVEVYEALGEHRRAKTIAGRARAVAVECHAQPLAGTLSRADDPGAPPAVPAGDMIDMLSDAERRVAALAAAGYTNREIAAKLYITISTVEQHLTRTYRKLNISRRADLPLVLEFGDQLVV